MKKKPQFLHLMYYLLKNKVIHHLTIKILSTHEDLIFLKIHQSVRGMLTVKRHQNFSKTCLLIDLHKTEKPNSRDKRRSLFLYLVIGSIHYKNIDINN